MVGRLFQIVYLLMERESITANELAEKLEVSVRTINRDIEKLSEARIPIFATRGRGGGISLLPDFVLNKKVLSEEEKTSILSSMKIMGTVAYEDEQQALLRLEEFFGETAQDWIEIELDNWGEGAFDKERFKSLKDAILTHKVVTFEYIKKNEISNRKVHPCKLVFRSNSWYLFAFCEMRKDFRYFKFHRMRNLEITKERFEPMRMPEENKENHYLKPEPSFEATVAIDKCMAYRAVDELSMKDVVDDGKRLIFQIKEAKNSWFYDYVFSYGPYAEVLEPEDVRNEVARRVEMLYKKY